MQRGSTPRLRVLILPSWYPSHEHPHAGIFIQQQAEALATRADVAVVHVRHDRLAVRPSISHERGITVIRCAAPTYSGSSSIAHRVRYVSGLTVGYRRACLAALRVVQESWGTPDVVHGHAAMPAAIGSRIVSGHLGIPFVVTEHQADYLEDSPGLRAAAGRLMPQLARWSTRSAYAMVAVSEHLARSLRSARQHHNVVVIPNLISGIDRPLRPYPAPTCDGPRFVHISLLRSYEKNIPMFLDALATLDRKGVGFRADFVGDGPDRTELEAVAAGLGLLGRRVRFLGAVPADQVRAALDSSCFSVVSSRYETFCMVAAESLAAGRPVVSTRCGGPESFVDESVGLLVPNDDCKAMADGIELMARIYPSYRPSALHAHARARFAPDVVLDQILSLYEAAIANSRKQEWRA